MAKSRVDRKSGGIHVIVLSFAITFLISSSAWAENSCVNCHTDEDMLTQNLGKSEKKKSTMQAGPG